MTTTAIKKYSSNLVLTHTQVKYPSVPLNHEEDRFWERTNQFTLFKTRELKHLIRVLFTKTGKHSKEIQCAIQLRHFSRKHPKERSFQSQVLLLLN
jgi:hypothetical protein